MVRLASDIKAWGRSLGFQSIGICDTDLSDAEPRFEAWLAQGIHGDMQFMETDGLKCRRPPRLVRGTLRIITARLDYMPNDVAPSQEILADSRQAFISRYALGRDYHKVLRARLQKLCDRISSSVENFNYRVFSDSAPVAEVELAQKSGIGWRGKHSLLLSREAGSWFFLGEIYTNLPLPIDMPSENHCGKCSACIDACPTGAIVAPYQVDARRCISYLTIELKGSIPVELRPKIGNRIYGCDDCQLCCPWNRFAQISAEPDFRVRHGLDTATLIELFAWEQAEFEKKTMGSAIRRIGHTQWLRNIAVGLGNGPPTSEAISALNARADHPAALVREHVAWALAELKGRQ